MSPAASRFLHRFGGMGFSFVLLIVLLAVNVALNPARFAPHAWGTLIGLAAPLIAAALASTPPILGGNGGIDVSVGPAMGFVNAIVVAVLINGAGIDSPFILVPVAILVGAAIGLVNGFLAAVVRIQPIVATLGTYLVLLGLTLAIVPSPTGTVPEWLRALSGQYSILPILAILAIWWGIQRFPYFHQLMATGSDQRAAYTSGVNVTAIRILAYVLGGMFAGLAGLSLSGLIGSADANVGPNFTLIAISAAALGGVSLVGGKGSLIGAMIGAIDVFLLQSALTYFNVSTFVLQVAYGLVLVLAVSFAALQERFIATRGRPS